MRVLISLTVHKQAAVVVSQLRNLIRYLHDPVIVLHVSRNFDVRTEDLVISERVLINPQRYSTAWGSGILVRAHMQNVRFAMSQVDFDYVAFHASNDLFVQTGVEAYMQGHAAGCESNAIGDWSWAPGCLRDRPLRNFCNHHGITAPMHGQLEGSFYRKDVFEDMLACLDGLESDVSWSHLSRASLLRRILPRLYRNPHYPREEVYFPTALAACGVLPTAAPYTYMNWNQKLDLSRDEVDAVRRCDYAALPDYEVSGVKELFAVKRVPRQTDDPLRKYISGLDSDNPL